METHTSQHLQCCAICMVSFSAFFFELKRLLAISPASRVGHDTTQPIISTSLLEPSAPLSTETGFPPPPLHRHISPDALYRITPLDLLEHPSSAGHTSLNSLTHPHVPTSYSPPTSSLQLHAYHPQGSDGSVNINVPPPAYLSGDQLPSYSYSESFVGPAWQRSGVRSGGLLDLVSSRRPRIGPVMGPMLAHSGDPSQNQYPGAYARRDASRRGRDMYRGALFARVIPARRNLWLPAIVVGAVIGVYVLVKAGGKDKEASK